MTPRLPLALAVVLAVALSPIRAAEAPPPAAVLVDPDFAGPFTPVHPDGPAAERISGGLPEGWADNSDWAKAWVDYSRAEQHGRAFLRVRVTRLDDGRAQFNHLLPDFPDDTYFRLLLTARSPARASLETGVRMAASPYEFLWSTRVPLEPEWRDYAFDFRLARNRRQVGLWINLDAIATVDLAAVRLVRMTRDGLIAELRRRHPDGGPPNLLRVSRMPLGIQSGWSIGRDNSDADDCLIEPDPAVTGPSGAPALALRSREKVVLYAAPFAVPLPFEKHTATFYGRGKAAGRFEVVCDGGGLASTDFRFDGDTWQRVEVPFSPVLLGRAHALRFQAAGDLWIDALQVNRGPKAEPYVPGAAAEVSLACASPARVQFDDELAAVRWAVTGAAPGARLKAKVVNLYGQEAALPDVALPDAFLAEGKWRYDRFPDRPYGPHRVEAWVEAPDGKPLGLPNELVVFRLRRPRYWRADAPDSPFGTHTNSTTRHVLMAKAVGVNWTRLHDAGSEYIGWYHLERKPGQWTFRDKELRRFRRHGLMVLGSLSTAPEWASYFQKPHNGYFDRFYQPRKIEDFSAYVRTVVSRYKDGVIDAWDVWNEPWIHAWWPVAFDESAPNDRDGYTTSTHAQADFVRLMDAARKTARDADPRVTVLGVNTTTNGPGTHNFSGTEWTRGILDAGGLDHCDVIAYHQYIGARVGFPDDAVARGYQAALGPILEACGGKPPKPVWMTEGSATFGLMGSPFYHHTLPYADLSDPVEPGDRLCRFVVSLLAQGVRKVFLYSMHCHTYFGIRNEHAMLLTDEGYLHPAAAAHSAMAWLLEDTRFARTVAPAPGVTAYLFQADGRAVAVLSPMPGHAAWTPPARQGLDVLDLLGNPLPPNESLGDRLVYLSARGTVDALEQALMRK